MIPKHIAIIPDGNRRWAKEKGFVAIKGHLKATENDKLKTLHLVAKKAGVKCFTAWGFSTDNWKRSETELKSLFKLFHGTIDSFKEDFPKEKIRFIQIGRKDRLPKELVEKIISLENDTKEFSDFTVCLALDYGGDDEIVRVTKKLVEKNLEINDENIKANLDTKDLPELDLIIRTSGEKRLSGFMPYQSKHSELIFLDKYFPDFTKEDLLGAIKEFDKRKRRFGK